MSRTEYHMGRTFSGTKLEDDCPCPKAACGLVIADVIATKGCEQHDPFSVKTIRQMHSKANCPAMKGQ